MLENTVYQYSVLIFKNISNCLKIDQKFSKLNNLALFFLNFLYIGDYSLIYEPTISIFQIFGKSTKNFQNRCFLLLKILFVGR